jgi:hypothetical protein
VAVNDRKKPAQVFKGYSDTVLSVSTGFKLVLYVLSRSLCNVTKDAIWRFLHVVSRIEIVISGKENLI